MSGLKIEVGKWYITKDGKKFYIAADARVNNLIWTSSYSFVAFSGASLYYFCEEGYCLHKESFNLISETTPKHPMEAYIGKMVYMWDGGEEKGDRARKLGYISSGGRFYDSLNIPWHNASPLSPEDITRNN